MLLAFQLVRMKGFERYLAAAALRLGNGLGAASGLLFPSPMARPKYSLSQTYVVHRSILVYIYLLAWKVYRGTKEAK